MKSLIRNLIFSIGLRRFYYFLLANCRAFYLMCRVVACRLRYAQQLRRIRRKPKEEKIRVLFIVSEIAKWKCQTVYEEMRDAGIFEPIVGISAWNAQSMMTDDQLAEYYKKADSFFTGLGVKHVFTVKTHPRRISDLREFNPDVVIFNEQWGPCGDQLAEKISHFALTCFIPYYVPDYGVKGIDCEQHTEIFSHTYFTLNEFWSKYYRKLMPRLKNVPRFVPVGHPALDKTVRQFSRKPQKKLVIYAPHFAYPGNKVSDWIYQGTFDWSGLAILDYARKHPEIKWAWKPHPLLPKALKKSGLMTQEEIDSYYKEWESIAEFSYDANYHEMFMESLAMITDSGSFLAEYGATGRPFIRLICSEDKKIVPEQSAKLWDTYYKVRNLDEMYSVFKVVLEDGLDPKGLQRLSAIEELGLVKNDAAKNIVNYLKKLLKH